MGARGGQAQARKILEEIGLSEEPEVLQVEKRYDEKQKGDEGNQRTSMIQAAQTNLERHNV